MLLSQPDPQTTQARFHQVHGEGQVSTLFRHVLFINLCQAQNLGKLIILSWFCRHGLESNVLRFVARLDTTRPIDMDRRLGPGCCMVCTIFDTAYI